MISTIHIAVKEFLKALKISFLGIFLFNSLGARTQGMIIQEESMVSEHHYRYEEMQEPESMPNYIIGKMALITAPTRDFFFGSTLFLHYQIVKNSNTEYTFRIHIDSLHQYNRLDFKGYQLDAMVFPNELNLSVWYQNKNTKQTYTKKLRQEYQYQSPYALEFKVQDSSAQAYFYWDSLRMNFQYSHQLRSELDSTLQAIITIEKLRPQLIDLRKRLAKLNEVKASVVGIYDIDLKHIEKELQESNPTQLVGKSNIERFHSEGIVALYDSLIKASHQRRKDFDNMKYRPEYSYFSEGFQAYQKGEREVAIAFFHKSINKKESYPPPYYYLALMAYEEQKFDSATALVIKVLNKLNDDRATTNKCLSLGYKLYDALTAKAKQQLKEKSINEAIASLQLALRLCNSTGELVCNEQAESLLQIARQELFESWISITESSIRSNNLAMAKRYLAWTQEFLHSYRTQIKDSSQLDSVRLGLRNLVLEKGIKDLAYQQNNRALQKFRFADSLALRMHALNLQVPDSLYQLARLGNQKKSHSNTEIIARNSSMPIAVAQASNSPSTQKRYNNYYLIGIKEFKEKNYFNAYTYFNTAYEIQTQSQIIIIDSLAFYRLSSGKKVILADLKFGELPAWGAQTETVKSIIKLAKQEAKLLQIEDDTEIVAAIQHLHKLAFENKCLNVSADFTLKVKQGNTSARLKQYLLAEQQWKDALELCRQNTECTIDSTLPLALLQQNRHSINYQKEKLNCKTYLAEGKDSLAIQLAQQLEIDFRIHELDKAGLLPFGPANLLNEKHPNVELQYHYVQYLLQIVNPKDLPIAITTLQNLSTQDKHKNLISKGVMKICLLDMHVNSSKSQIKQKAKEHFPSSKKLQKLYVKNALKLKS